MIRLEVTEQIQEALLPCGDAAWASGVSTDWKMCLRFFGNDASGRCDCLSKYCFVSADIRVRI